MITRLPYGLFSDAVGAVGLYDIMRYTDSEYDLERVCKESDLAEFELVTRCLSGKF
jgi:hypothetical protein